MSWVTLDRICQEEADGQEDVRRELVRNGKLLRSSAEPLSDDELLAKLRDFGLDVDRDGVRYAFLARRVGQPLPCSPSPRSPGPRSRLCLVRPSPRKTANWPECCRAGRGARIVRRHACWHESPLYLMENG
jgi:hypothetical protein